MIQTDVCGAPNDDPEGTAERQPNLLYDEVPMLSMTAAQQDEYRDWWRRYSARRDAHRTGAGRSLPVEAVAIISAASR